MLPTPVPEIQRTNLCSVVLNLKAMGINDVALFDFMDPPPIQTVVNSLETLWNLGALDDEGRKKGLVAIVVLSTCVVHRDMSSNFLEGPTSNKFFCGYGSNNSTNSLKIFTKFTKVYLPSFEFLWKGFLVNHVFPVCLLL
jgi:hypothetical protein